MLLVGSVLVFFRIRCGCSDEITRAAPGGRARGRVRSLTLVDGLIRRVDDVGVSS